MKKAKYQSPITDVVSLQSMRETMLEYSMTGGSGTGTDTDNPDFSQNPFGN